MKKGLSFVLMNYHFDINGRYSVFVAVFAGDGTVGISHGGIECGQGINTKVWNHPYTIVMLVARK